MDYWEFLLQKEGDQAWLPLESSQVEILEGRYRVVAHSSQLKCPVNVRISQFLLDQVPPRRRIMKRSGQTNESGLMVVMPFTWLNAGLWEIHCSDSDDSGVPATWEYAIQLRVMAQDANENDDWYPEDWPADRVPHADNVTFGPGGEPDFNQVPAPPINAATIPESVLISAFETIDRALAESVVSGEESSSQGLGLSSSHRIELAQSALMVNQGQPLMVVGQVQAAALSGPVLSGSLALRLLDPQSAQVVRVVQQLVLPQPMPAAFAIPVELPADLNTRLLLGELILVEPTAGSVRVMALQRFTVTVDLAALLDAIANQAETDENFDIVFPGDGGSTSDDPLRNIAGVDLEPPAPTPADLPAPPPRAMPTLLLPKSGLSLPPKLYYPTPHEAATRRPQLPPLASPRTSPDGSSLPTPDAPIAEPLAPEPPVKADAPPAAQRSATVQLPQFGRPRPKAPAEPPDPTPPTPAPAAPPSPIDSEFRTLNLQDRFWSRLNALAVEAHEVAMANRQAEEAANSANAASATSISDAEQPLLEDPWVAEPFAGEVVIYDDPEEPPTAPKADLAPEAAEPSSVPTEDIISPPMPSLELPDGELLAGDRVTVTLRVPFHVNRVYLKVWITDPQTRTLADEPRQLTHLTPDGRGNLEGNLQLTVPQGCLEAWFEAIAVDMVTQQESYKASVSRSVIPPEVKTPALDEFEL